MQQTGRMSAMHVLENISSTFQHAIIIIILPDG